MRKTLGLGAIHVLGHITDWVDLLAACRVLVFKRRKLNAIRAASPHPHPPTPNNHKIHSFTMSLVPFQHRSANFKKKKKNKYIETHILPIVQHHALPIHTTRVKCPSKRLYFCLFALNTEAM